MNRRAGAPGVYTWDVISQIASDVEITRPSTTHAPSSWRPIQSSDYICQPAGTRGARCCRGADRDGTARTDGAPDQNGPQRRGADPERTPESSIQPPNWTRLGRATNDPEPGAASPLPRGPGGLSGTVRRSGRSRWSRGRDRRRLSSAHPAGSHGNRGAWSRASAHD